MFGDRGPKRLPLLRILCTRVAAGADQSGRSRGHGITSLIEREHRDLESLSRLSEHVSVGNLDLVHLEETGVPGEDSPLLFQRSTRESLERAFDDERADARGIALLLFLEIRPGKDEKVVGNVRQRNPHLLAGQVVPVSLLDGHRLNSTHIAAGGRLGQPVRRDLLSSRLRHQIALLLILCAPREEQQAVQSRVHRHVDVLEFLGNHAEADVIHSRAAVLRRHRAAEQAELGHLRQDVPVEPVFAIEFPYLGRHLARAPFAD